MSPFRGRARRGVGRFSQLGAAMPVRARFSEGMGGGGAEAPWPGPPPPPAFLVMSAVFVLPRILIGVALIRRAMGAGRIPVSAVHAAHAPRAPVHSTHVAHVTLRVVHRIRTTAFTILVIPAARAASVIAAHECGTKPSPIVWVLASVLASPYEDGENQNHEREDHPSEHPHWILLSCGAHVSLSAALGVSRPRASALQQSGHDPLLAGTGLNGRAPFRSQFSRRWLPSLEVRRDRSRGPRAG